MTAHTAYTASSHEATKNSFSRRALIGGSCRSAQRLRQRQRKL